MAIYTCPMHPEVQSDHPNNCSRCGMKLQPRDMGPRTTTLRPDTKRPLREQ